MAQTTVLITHDESATDMGEIFNADSGNKVLASGKLSAYVSALAGGARTATVVTSVGAAKATGTFTFNAAAENDTVLINGVTFTAKVAPAGAFQFALGANDEAAAANLAAFLNASSTVMVSGMVEASASAKVVTITSKRPGYMANAITIEATGGIAANAARLGGGSNGTEKTHSFG